MNPVVVAGDYPVQGVSPKSASSNRRKWIDVVPPKKVRFPSLEAMAFGKLLEEEDPIALNNPQNVSAVICGFSILTEREADYQLSQSIQDWKKLLFLLSNLPYFALACVAISLSHIQNHAFYPEWEPYCSSSVLHALLAFSVSLTSSMLHASQVRVGHWCCSHTHARTFHRRKVQDRFDLADCTCAFLAVVLGVVCHGLTELGSQMMVAIPVFVLSIVAKKLRFWNTYLLLHSVWHFVTAYLLWNIFFPGF